MDKNENPGAGETAHGASECILADASDYTENGTLKQDLPRNYGCYISGTITGLWSHLCKLDHGFSVHKYPDIHLNMPRPETSRLSYEEEMLSHALEIVPELTIEEQAGLVNSFIKTHRDPLDIDGCPL